MAKIVIITQPLLRLSINDRTYMTNKDGVLELDSNDILLTFERGVSEFDRVCELTKEQKKALYKFLVSATRFGIVDIEGVLLVNRSIAKAIIMLLFQHDIVKKFDTQWRVIDEKKIGIMSMLKYIEAKEKDENAVQSTGV